MVLGVLDATRKIPDGVQCAVDGVAGIVRWQTVSAKTRVFVSQPIAPSALERLRAIASVKINTDSSRIIAKPKLIAAVKKCDILFSLLHDRIDRAVLAANPKLRAVCSMSITPDNIDVAEATKRGIPGHRRAADRGGSDCRHSFRR